MQETAAAGYVDRHHFERGKGVEKCLKIRGGAGVTTVDNHRVCAGQADLESQVSVVGDVAGHENVGCLSERSRNDVGEHVRHSRQQDAHVLQSLQSSRQFGADAASANEPFGPVDGSEDGPDHRRE